VSRQTRQRRGESSLGGRIAALRAERAAFVRTERRPPPSVANSRSVSTRARIDGSDGRSDPPARVSRVFPKIRPDVMDRRVRSPRFSFRVSTFLLRETRHRSTVHSRSRASRECTAIPCSFYDRDVSASPSALAALPLRSMIRASFIFRLFIPLFTAETRTRRATRRKPNPRTRGLDRNVVTRRIARIAARAAKTWPTTFRLAFPDARIFHRVAPRFVRAFVAALPILER